MLQNKKSVYAVYWILDCLAALLVMYVLAPAPGVRTFLEGRQRSRFALYAAVVFAVVSVVLYCLRSYGYRRLESLNVREACIQFGERFHIGKRELLVLAVFVVIGAWLRFRGIGWGIDHIFQPDEKKLVRRAIEMAAELTPYHHSYGYPNQFVSKIAALCMLVYSKLFDEKLRGNTIVCYFIFRGCIAFLSTGLIVLSYLIGNYLRKGVGLLLAAYVTVFPPFINYAKQVTGDINVLFFSALVLLCGFYYLEKERKRDICAMTLFAAFVTLEKWHGGIICLYIAVLIVFCCKRNWKRLLLEGTLAFVSWVFWIFLIAPNVIWELGSTVAEIVSIFISEDSIWLPDDMPVFFLNCFFSHGGIVCTILVLIGLLYVFLHREKKYLALVFGAINWLVMSTIMNRSFERWGMDCYFTLLILLAVGTYALVVSKRWICKAVGALAALLVLGTYFIGSMRYVYLSTHSIQDTRIIGEQVLWELGIKQDNSIYEYYTPFSPGGIRAVEEGEGQKEKTMEDYVVSENGQVYITEPDAVYAVASSYRDWGGDGHRLLAENGQLLVRLDTSMNDLFSADRGKGSWKTPEPVNCKKNIEEIRKILAGENMGPEINIYDISMIPRKTLEE